MTLRLLIWVLRLRRWALDRQLLRHVRQCQDRRCKGSYAAEPYLENVDQDSFCKQGERLFNWSCDISFEITVQEEHAEAA